MKRLFSVTLICLSFWCSSQTEGLKIKTISAVIGEDNTQVKCVLGYSDGNTYICSRDYKKYFIQKFDKDLVLQQSLKLGSWSINDPLNEPVGGIASDKRLFVFTREANNMKRKITLSIDAYDLNTLEWISNIDAQVFACDDMKWPYYNDNNVVLDEETNESGFVVSENGKFIAMHASPIGKGKSNVDSLVIKVFNDRFDLVWEKHHAITAKESLSRFLDLEVTNEGNVFVLMQHWFDEDHTYDKEDKPLYAQEVHAFVNMGSEVIITPIAIPGIYINQSAMGISPENFVVVSSIGGTSSGKQWNTMVYTKFDPKSGKAGDKGFDDIPEEKLISFMPEDKVAKYNETQDKALLSLPECRIGELLFFPNGDWNTTAEIVIIRNYPDEHGARQVFTTYGNLFAIGQNTQGTIKWIETIRKQQAPENALEPSHKALMNGNSMCLLYNTGGNGSSCSGVLVSISPEGKSQYTDIFSKPSNRSGAKLLSMVPEMQMMTSAAKFIQPGRLFLGSPWKNEPRYYIAEITD